MGLRSDADVVPKKSKRIHEPRLLGRFAATRYNEIMVSVPWSLTMPLTLSIDPPADLARFRLPVAVAARLQWLLDRQDAGHVLTPDERAEAEGLVDVADLLSLLRLRAERGAA